MSSGGFASAGARAARTTLRLWTITDHEKQIAGEHHAGRNTRGRIPQAEGHYPVQAGEGHWCSSAPDQRDCEGAAGDYGGHGAPPGAVFRHVAGILAEPANAL